MQAEEKTTLAADEFGTSVKAPGQDVAEKKAAANNVDGDKDDAGVGEYG